MDIKYEYETSYMPIKSASFITSGKSQVTVRLGFHDDKLEMLSDCKMNSYNAKDLADLIALLQKFHKQMEG